jgi:toxin-antitoxin system PIN domain toxin
VTWLPDGNLLVALRLDSHVHHERAHRWFAGLGRDRFATCAVTQGTLLRVHLRLAMDNSAEAAWQALSDFIQHPRHEFWEAGFSYAEVPHEALVSSGQVADAWLCELARRKRGRLATLDEPLARTQPEVANLVPR